MLARVVLLGLAVVAAACPDAPAPADSPASPRAAPTNVGFPQYDPAREVTLFGRLLPDDPPIHPRATPTVGEWRIEDTRLLASATEPFAEQWWFPSLDAAHIGNGMIRARIEASTRMDASVLVRHQIGAGTSTPSGYAVTIADGRFGIVRWDAGVALPIVPSTALSHLVTRSSLEVVVVVMGAQILASVYDGGTLEHLATSTAHDTTYDDGQVGIRVGPAHDRGAAITFLSAMDATRPTIGSAARPHAGRSGARDAGSDPPLAEHRYVFLAASDAVALPGWARRHVKAWTDTDDGEEAVLALDPVAHERLLRTGVRPASVRGDVAWKVLHPEFHARAGKQPEPRGRGFVLDDSYKDAEIVSDLLHAYHHAHPEITDLVRIGETHQGRPIYALEISDHAARDEDEPAVLFDATHHASELLSTEYVLDIVDTLVTGYGEDPRVTKWVDGAEIWCLPVVNPDGLHRFIHESLHAARKNARDLDLDGRVTPFEGVDLNRNYPFAWGEQGTDHAPLHRWYRGPSPGSEPEVAAVMRLAQAHHFAAVLSFHTLGTDIYPPYLVADRREVSPDVFGAIARELAQAAPLQPGGKHYAIRDPPHAVDGCAHDWHTHEYGAAAFAVEGTHHNPDAEIRRRSIEGVRPIWMALLDRVTDGPWIGGRVRDTAGNPLVAEVMLKELETFEAESWTTRARDGRFDRAVGSPGRYTLVASADGHAPTELAVDVGTARVDVTIALTPARDHPARRRR